MKIFLKESKRRLELYEGEELEFSKTNPLYEFDELGDARTTEFAIPASVYNQHVLGFANSIYLSGASMRQKRAALLIEGVLQYEGNLYILDYDFEKHCYNVCFVFAERQILREVENLGNIREFVFTDEFVLLDNNFYTLPRVIGVPLYDKEVYYNNIWEGGDDLLQSLPSINVDAFINSVLTPALQSLLGVSVELPFDPEVISPPLMLLTNTLNFFDKVGTFKISRTVSKDQYRGIWVLEFFERYKNRYIVAPEEGLETQDDLFASSEERCHLNMATGRQDYTYFFLYANYDMQITFPDDFPTELFMKKHNLNIPSTDYLDYSKFFYGDYYFEPENMLPGAAMIVHGDPLAGKTLSLEKGERFTFLKASEWVVYSPDADWTYADEIYGHAGWDGFGDPYTIDMRVKADATVKCIKKAFDEDTDTYGIKHIATLQANLPQVSALTLLRDYATLHNSLLFLDMTTNTIKFDSAAFEYSASISIDDRTVNTTILARTFKDFVQRNIVTFQTNEHSNYSLSYDINNDSLDEERDLYSLLATNGERFDRWLQVTYDGDDYEGYGMVYCRYVVANMSGRLGYLTFALNDKIRVLCDKSTRAEVEVYMTFGEYEKLRPFSVIFWRGRLWTWTEANYANPTVLVTLQLIA